MRPRPTRRYAAAAAAVLGLTACGGAVTGSPSKTPGSGPGSRSRPAAQGQTVSLWMWGGDPKGNAYVDGVLAHAAARAGVALRRVPIADTKDALSRILAEKQAGRADGEVDLVWVNGDDFATGRQAGAWACDWADHLPNARFLALDDPLLGSDFGTDVAGCEAPWHKAQFSLVYDSARVTNPPTSLAGVLDWRPPTRDGSPTPHPRTFTGSVFVRQVLCSVSGGYANIPAHFDQAAYDRLTPAPKRQARGPGPLPLAAGPDLPSGLGRARQALRRRRGQHDHDLRPGDAAQARRRRHLSGHDEDAHPRREDGGQRQLPGHPLDLRAHRRGEGRGQPGAVTRAAGGQGRRRDVGQFTVLDPALLPVAQRERFHALPSSPVVPAYDVLSQHANPELAAAWVPAIDEGWRRAVPGASS